MFGYGGPKPGRAGGGSFGANAGDFLYQPGGVAVGRVYTSWVALYAAYTLAIAAGERGVDIFFDDTFTSPAVIPAGAYSFDPTTTWRGSIHSDDAPAAFVEVALADGVTLATGPGMIADFLRITSQSALPVVTVGLGDFYRLVLGLNSTIRCSGAGSFIEVQDGGFGRFILLENAALQLSVTEVIDVLAGGEALITALASGASVATGTITGAAGSTVSFQLGDAAAALSLTQAGLIGISDFSRAVDSYFSRVVHPLANFAGPGNYDVVQDDSVVLVDTSAGAATVTLPLLGVSAPVEPAFGGRQIIVKRTTGGDDVTIVPQAGETIDGEASYTLDTDLEAVILVGDSPATTWHVVGQSEEPMDNAAIIGEDARSVPLQGIRIIEQMSRPVVLANELTISPLNTVVSGLITTGVMQVDRARRIMFRVLWTPGENGAFPLLYPQISQGTMSETWTQLAAKGSTLSPFAGPTDPPTYQRKTWGFFAENLFEVFGTGLVAATPVSIIYTIESDDVIYPGGAYAIRFACQDSSLTPGTITIVGTQK